MSRLLFLELIFWSWQKLYSLYKNDRISCWCVYFDVSHTSIAFLAWLFAEVLSSSCMKHDGFSYMHLTNELFIYSFLPCMHWLAEFIVNNLLNFNRILWHSDNVRLSIMHVSLWCQISFWPFSSSSCWCWASLNSLYFCFWYKFQ